jgi:putative ABC transport system permease protein
MQSLIRDVRYAIRQLFHTPAFTAVAILTLALGIGANSAMFSIVNAVLLRPLPYPDAARLARIRGGSSYLDLVSLSERSGSIERFAGYREQFFDLTQGSQAERIHGALVTGNTFAAFGFNAALGRTISAKDDISDGPHVAVLSDALWNSIFHRDRSVIGKSISFSGTAYTVIGVMPAGFQLPQVKADIWAALNAESKEEAEARGAHSLYGVMQLKKDVSIRAAQADFDRIAKDLAKLYPDENTDRRYLLISLHDYLVRDARSTLWMLLGAVAFVLLIASTNVANLLLARASGRSREIAVRAALGASRVQILRQLLLESMLLGLIGGFFGLLTAFWASDFLMSLRTEFLPGVSNFMPDWRVLLFTAGISLLTGLIFGAAPALYALGLNLHDCLKEGKGAAFHQIRGRFRNLLVVGEVMLALVLLIGAGLLLRSLYRLQRVDPGFHHHNLITMNITLPLRGYSEISKRTRFFDDALGRIQRLPGVESAAATSDLPFGTGATFHNMIFSGRAPVAAGTEPEIYSRSISPDYFRTMGIPVTKGRVFTARDSASSYGVAIINEAMARQYFKGEEPIGKKVQWAREELPHELTIVGIVGNIHSAALDTEEVPAVYTPYSQETRFWKSWMNLVVRTSTPGSVTAAIRKEIAQVDREIPLADISSMESLLANSFTDRRFMLLMLASFAGLALVLSAIGIYGVISYTVSQSKQEVGVRLALGATTGDILRLIVLGALRLTIVGLAGGIVTSFLLTRLLNRMLFGIKATDPLTFLTVSLLLLMTAFLASYVPARRATKVDPIAVLRYE